MALTALIKEHGGPENFVLEDLPVGNPGPGEVRIAHKAVGLNFIDVYQRTGLYPMDLPHAHTCFNLLSMPAYASRGKLRDRLTIAIHNAQGFGLA